MRRETYERGNDMKTGRRISFTQKVSRREAMAWKVLLLASIALLAFLFTTVQGWLFPLD